MLKKICAGRVVELVGVARADQADVVDDFRQMRQGLGEFEAALAVAGELELRPQHGGVGADEGVALTADDRRRERLAFHLGELRLVVEQIELARRAGHEQVDDGLRLAGEVGRMRGHGVRPKQAAVLRSEPVG